MRIEQRLFVFLQILVVGEGKPLERRQEAGQVAHRPPRLAPQQLCAVGVLLVGHHRRAGRHPIVQLQKAELRGRPEHPLLAPPAQVEHQHGAGVEEVCHKVPVRHGVEAVGADGGKPERTRRHLAVDRQARARAGAAAERRDIGRCRSGLDAHHVTRQHLRIGEQVVAQCARHAPLQVGVGRQQRLRLALGPLRQHHDQACELRHERRRSALHIEPRVGRHLVVPAPRRVQPLARLTDKVGQPTLHRHVDVFIHRQHFEGACLELRFDRRQPLQDGRKVVGRQQPAGLQHPGVRPRPGEVFAPEHDVEGDRLVDVVERRRGGRTEPACPGTLLRHGCTIRHQASAARA